ncbi:MAG: HIT family protein [Actinobacteria bacterium]|nr:HIT family protein [Actinomycetota bacterium]
MACVFCEIVDGSRDALVVDETDRTLAFLDMRPVFHGHTLVVPRDHHETILDLPADVIGPVFAAVQRVTGAVIEAMGADGAFVAVNNRISQSVPHLHVHVVPRRTKDGLKGFFWLRHPYASDDEAAEVAARIRSALS